jgi:hypothetical protein
MKLGSIAAATDVCSLSLLGEGFITLYRSDAVRITKDCSVSAAVADPVN